MLHLRWEETQDNIAAKHPAVANDARSINFCEPRIMISDAELPFLTNVVIIADPDDASRLAKSHIKKATELHACLLSESYRHKRQCPLEKAARDQ